MVRRINGLTYPNPEAVYQVNEQFRSVQGEGVLTGTPCTFVRLQGCTVGCPWCDSGPLADLLEKRNTNGETRNTWGRGGYKQTVREIVEKVETAHVVITGGEPTLYDLDPLIDALWDKNCAVQLETSGQNNLKGSLVPEHITWSPKANLKYEAAPMIRNYAKEVKFVVDADLQLDTVLDCANYYFQRFQYTNEECPTIVLMPEGCPPSQANVDKTLSWLTGLPLELSIMFRFGDRLQYRLGVR